MINECFTCFSCVASFPSYSSLNNSCSECVVVLLYGISQLPPFSLQLWDEAGKGLCRCVHVCEDLSLRVCVYACVRGCLYDLGVGNGLDVMSAFPGWNFPDDVISILYWVCVNMCVCLGGAKAIQKDRKDVRQNGLLWEWEKEIEAKLWLIWN